MSHQFPTIRVPRSRVLHDLGLCVLEARPVVQVMFVLRFMVGASGAPFTTLSIARELTGAASWLCATLFVYLANGVSDVDGDRLNGSSRPIASGRLAVGAARRYAGAFAAAAMALALPLGGMFPLLVMAMLVLGYLYSFGIAAKNNVFAGFGVAALGGFVTYVAGVSVSGPVSPAPVVFGATMAAWMMCGGQVKDFGEVLGDAAAGRRTLPVMLGEGRAKLLVACLLALFAVGVAVLPFLLPPLWPCALLAPFSIAMIVSMVHRPITKRTYRGFMASQITANLMALVAASSW